MSAEPAATAATVPTAPTLPTGSGEVGGADFVLVCRLEDLPVGTAAQADVDGVVVAMVRDAEGDRCTHADVSLSEGEVDGCTLECWLHGSRFDLRTGEPTGPPATVAVAVYPVKIDGDDVYVSVTKEP